MTITIDILQKALPSTLRSSATQDLADILNQVSTNQEAAEVIRENFLGYTSILGEGRYKMEDYLNAVKYVSYKLLKHSNQEAYVKTFPQRYQRLVALGTSPKDISSHVHQYSRNKLVNRILEQTIIPVHVLNMDLYQEAINTQATIMRDVNVSPKVRSDAADSLMTHLAKPKEVGPLINMDMRDTSGVREMREMFYKMAQQQQGMISAGATAKEVAAQDIVAREIRDENH